MNSLKKVSIAFIATMLLSLSLSVGAFADELILVEPGNLPGGWRLPKSIGHVTNYLVHEWYQNLTKGERMEAEKLGIQFSINDANLDLQRSLAAIDDYLAKDVDVMVVTPVDEKATSPTVRKAMRRGTKVINESSPVQGAITLVANDDYAAGRAVGKWAADYIREHLNGEARILDIGLPALTTTVARSNGFLDAIKDELGEPAKVVHVDGKGLKDEAVRVSANALTANPDINVIFGINDDSALGGLQSFRAAGFDESRLLVVGFGLEGNAGKGALREGGPYKVSLAMFPEYQGKLLIQAAINVYNDHPVPEHIVAPTIPVTKETLDKYYTQEGDEWKLNFGALNTLYRQLKAEGKI